MALATKNTKNTKGPKNLWLREPKKRPSFLAFFVPFVAIS